jgi:hypothetical protein
MACSSICHSGAPSPPFASRGSRAAWLDWDGNPIDRADVANDDRNELRQDAAASSALKAERWKRGVLSCLRGLLNGETVCTPEPPCRLCAQDRKHGDQSRCGQCRRTHYFELHNRWNKTRHDRHRSAFERWHALAHGRARPAVNFVYIVDEVSPLPPRACLLTCQDMCMRQTFSLQHVHEIGFWRHGNAVRARAGSVYLANVPQPYGLTHVLPEFRRILEQV